MTCTASTCSSQVIGEAQSTPGAVDIISEGLLDPRNLSSLISDMAFHLSQSSGKKLYLCLYKHCMQST